MIFQGVRRASHAICFALAGAAALSSASAEMRTWIDDQGREVRAEFAGMSADGQSVQLMLETKSVVPFPLSRLSEPCRSYAKDAMASRALEAQYNFKEPWPELIGFREDPEIEVIREDADAGEFVYESVNFRFISDVRLRASLVRGLALLFEATHLYCKMIPIGMGDGTRTDGKYLIKLYEDAQDYYKAGAPQGSAGVFMGGRNRIKVPLESMGVRKTGSSYTLDRSASNRVLAHEIAHQLTPPAYFGQGEFNSWFIEGIAEYVAVTPYRTGQYNTRAMRRAAVNYATGFSREDQRGRNIGTEIPLLSLQAFMDLSYAEFVGTNANFNYAVGLLLTYYFIHLDGDGDATNLRAYKRALLEGKNKDEAGRLLLNGRTFKELEAEVESKWRRHGVRFRFGT
jgi:hypothetical protein